MPIDKKDLRAIVIAVVLIVGIVAAQETRPEPKNQTASKSQGELTMEDALKMGGDVDHDGIPNLSDNCPFVANRGQEDSVGDGIGDACRVIEFARQDLARRLDGNVAVLGIGVSIIRETLWPDKCLGVPERDRKCGYGRTKGFTVVFRVTARTGEKYEYHTDRDKHFRYAGPRK